jgi:hypothetical protein
LPALPTELVLPPVAAVLEPARAAPPRPEQAAAGLEPRHLDRAALELSK